MYRVSEINDQSCYNISSAIRSLSLSSPPLPREQLEKLIQTVIQEEGNERMLEWSVNDNGELDICVE